MPGALLPRPPMTNRRRSQAEAFLVLRRNILELWGEAAYEEDVLPGRFLGREQLIINAPDAIHHVLVENHENYTRNATALRVLRPLLGEGLFLAEGDAWRRQRRTIAPAMSPRTMPILAGHVVAAATAKEAELGALNGRPIELMPQLQHLALRIAAQSMFSLEADDFAAELRACLMRYGLEHATPGVLDLVLPRTIASPGDRRRAAFRRDWLAMMDRVIASRAPAEPDQPRDLYDLLAAARDPQGGQGFDRALLRDEIATMIIAGHETTAVTLFWACYAAARLPEAQAAVAHEAGALDLSEAGAAGSLKSLVRTRAFVDEVLRLYPPAFLIVREARGEDVVLGHRIRRGTLVSISPWVLHRHQRRWQAPDLFDPSRFMPGAPTPQRYAYLPFGAGPRVCVGAQFALTEAVLVLARLLARFRLELVGTGAVLPRGIVTTQPDRPVRFRLVERQASKH